jgi:hypothetical protein
MRTLLWLILLVGGYFWLVTSGNDDAFISQGKKAYQTITSWFDDTEIDFHFKKPSTKKKSRRWD